MQTACRRMRRSCLLEQLVTVLLLLASAPRTECLYHTAGDILHFFSHGARSNPQLMSFEMVDLEAVRLPLATITNQSAAAGIKRVAVLTFGQHAVEVITSEVALWLAQALLGDMDELLGLAQTRAALQDAGIQTAAPGCTLRSWRDNILQKLELKLIPIENLDGRELFEAGEVCRRRTGSGVDLNRNWGHAWAPASKHSESYGGAKPFSEPQSHYIRERAEEWNPTAFINTHSGEWAVYVPWDSRQSVGSGLPMTQLQSLMDSLGAVCHCITGPAGAVSGYLAYGTTMDYMYVELGVPYALTIEVYGAGNEGKLKPGEHNQLLSSFPITKPDEVFQGLVGRRMLRNGTGQRSKLDPVLEMVASARPSLQRCFHDYNPVTTSDYQDVIARWVVMLMLTLNLVADAP